MTGAAQAERQTTADTAVTTAGRQENKGKTWGNLLLGLEDHMLVECYFSAVEMNLDKDFIDLLRNEIVSRKIDLYTHIFEDKVARNA